MNVLVTGGAGYIGSHTCKALSDAGMEPVVFDNLVSGHDWAVKWGALEQGDLLDRDRIAEVVSRVRPDGVIHVDPFESVFLRCGDEGERAAFFDALLALSDAGSGLASSRSRASLKPVCV